MRQDDSLYSNVVMNINAKHIYQAFRLKSEMEPQRSIQKSQVEAIADSFGMMFSAFRPLDLMICMGSQAEKDGDLLIEPAKKLFYENSSNYSLPGLKLPSIEINDLVEPGVLGAVSYLLSCDSKDYT